VDQILSAELNGRSANQGKPIMKFSLAQGLECWTRQLPIWHRILLGSQLIFVVNMLQSIIV